MRAANQTPEQFLESMDRGHDLPLLGALTAAAEAPAGGASSTPKFTAHTRRDLLPDKSEEADVAFMKRASALEIPVGNGDVAYALMRNLLNARLGARQAGVAVPLSASQRKALGVWIAGDHDGAKSLARAILAT